jgi:hypothetical protein
MASSSVRPLAVQRDRELQEHLLAVRELGGWHAEQGTPTFSIHPEICTQELHDHVLQALVFFDTGCSMLIREWGIWKLRSNPLLLHMFQLGEARLGKMRNSWLASFSGMSAYFFEVVAFGIAEPAGARDKMHGLNLLGKGVDKKSLIRP